jgi:hypothetical protein
MDSRSHSCVVMVKVRCIHRQTHELFDRYYHVDLSCLPEDRKAAFSALTQDVLLTHEFLAVRTEMEKVDSEPPCPDLRGGSFHVTSPVDYFEDEEGTPLDSVMLAAVMTGDSHPVVLNDARSIMRLGPCGIRSAEAVTVQQANDIAHFLQLVEIIGNSNWRKNGSTITSTGGFSPQSPLANFACPNLSDTYVVLLPLRQLFFEDGASAFGLAINAYRRVAADERKTLWIGHVRKSVDRYLQSKPMPPVLGDCSVSALLNAIMYGAGLIHWHRSTAQNKSLFAELVQKYKREWVVFVFTSCCQQLFGFAHQAYCVIRQDFEYWRAEGLFPESDIMKMTQLFDSHPLS